MSTNNEKNKCFWPTPNIILSIWIAFSFGLILLLKPEIILGMSPGAAVWLTFITLIIISFIAWRQAVGMGDNPWISPLFLHIAVSLALQTASGLLLVVYWKSVTAITGWNPVGLTNLLIYLPKVSWLILLGTLGAYIGLIFPVRFITIWLPKLDWPINENHFSLRAGILMFFIIAFFYIAARPGILPSSFQYLGWTFGEFGKVIFIAGIMQILLYRKSVRRWKAIVIAWVLSYIPFVLYGSRSAIVWPLVLFAWTYLAVRKRLSRKILIMTVAFLFLFVVVIFPLLTVYKYAIQDPEGFTIKEAMTKATASISGKNKTSIMPLFLEIFRIRTIPGFFIANYIQCYPEYVPYLKGESFYVVMSAMVPRIIIPNKQDVSYYINKLSYDVGMGNEKSAVVSRTYIDAISEFYINFGPIGVFFLSILHGMYLQARFDWLIRRSKFSLGFPIYAAAFFGPAAFWHTLVLDSKNFIFWIILLWFLSHRIVNTAKVEE